MKYFAFGDVHGYYDELIESLNKAGYDRFNPDHCLIGLGDYFDRGKKSKQVLEFLQSAPQKFLLLGNHEAMLLEMMRSKDITWCDISNGVLETIASFTGLSENEIYYDMDNAVDALIGTGLKFFIRDLQFYFKTNNYFFTHAWVPKTIPFESAPWFDWRSAIEGDTIEILRRPTNRGLEELERTNRKLVVGHFYTLLLRENIYNDRNTDRNAIWEYKNVIALDGCTPLSHKVNIFVFEDEPLATLLTKQE